MEKSSRKTPLLALKHKISSASSTNYKFKWFSENKSSLHKLGFNTLTTTTTQKEW